MLPKQLLFLLVTSPVFASQAPFLANTDSLVFQLRHRHRLADNNRIVFSNIPQPAASLDILSLQSKEAFILRTQTVTTHRPSSFVSYEHGRTRRSWCGGKMNDARERIEEFSWIEEEVVGPNVTDRETLLLLAKMTQDAYVDGSADVEWYDLEGGWNDSYPFGWEDDGFRGHVFATPNNSTIVISIKGTSTALIGSGGPTAKNDKLNDNMLFSCCCARVGFTWTPVCGCYAGSGKCDQNCLEASLADESLFYPVGTNLYNNVSYMYPDSNIWLIGHSLGGAVASLLGVTFGAPVVAFEAPGEKLAAGRLHLPSPPSTQHVTHVYHTADPIPMGTCNGVFSPCAIGGFAFESRCHLGKSIVYDTVAIWGWSVSLRTHSILVVIEQLLAQDWPTPPGSTPTNDSEVSPVPEAKYEEECVECYNWDFGDYIDPGQW